MINLAIADNPHYALHRGEIDRDQDSFSIITLTELHRAQPEAHLYLIMGDDVFAQLSSWHQWQSLLDDCHILVINRSPTPPEHTTEFRAWFEPLIAPVDHCRADQAGKICFIDLPRVNISATMLRTMLQSGSAVEGIPQPVLDYIQQEKLYR